MDAKDTTGRPSSVGGRHRAVEGADRPPAVRAADRVEPPGDPLGASASSRPPVTSSMAAATASTMRSISSAVVVSIGMSTITSPSGRISTPRSTHAADTRRPQRRPSAGGASSMPTISPRWRTSSDRRRAAATSLGERGRQLLGAGRARWRARRRSSNSSRWRSATAAARAFPL